MNAKMNPGNGQGTAGTPLPRQRRRLLAAAMATSFAAVSIIAYASGSAGLAAHHDGGSHTAGMHEGRYAEIDLAHLHGLVHHLMDRGTAEQKARIIAVVQAAEPELDALNQQAMAARRQKIELLLQDEVDRGALERARANELQVAGQLSGRIDLVLSDLVALMTPEQRAQLRAHVMAHAG